MRNWIERHQVLGVALLGGLAYIAWELRFVLVVLFLGYILAAALRPAVDWLQGHGLPRVAGILGIYIAFFGALGWILATAVGPLMSQAQSFGLRLTELSHQVTHQLPFVGPAQMQSLINYVQSQAGQAAASSFTVAAGGLSALIISIYLLYDWHRLHARGEGQPLRAWWSTVRDSERALGAWVRGQVLLSAAVGVLSFIALMVLGIEFAPVLAVLAFLFEFVPYAGPFLAGAPAVFIALNDSTMAAILVIVAYVVIQQLEAHLLVPLIMRRATDLHPVVVIGVMLAGFEIMGIIGVVLAVPVAVMARIAWQRLWHA